MTTLKMSETDSVKQIVVDQQPETYVDPIYSYAYGRSNETLLFKTLGSMLDETCAKVPNQLAIISVHEDYQCTFKQFADDVDCLASCFLNSLHVSRGDVIATMTGNTYKSLLIQYACAKIGAILSPINAFYTKHEVEFSLNKVNPKLFFIPGPESDQEKCINKFYTLITSIGDSLPKSLECIVFLDGTKPEKLTKIGKSRVIMFDEMFKSARNFVAKQTDENGNKLILSTFNDADSPATLLFTSGTTGPPKAAILSHHNIVNNIRLAGARAGITYGSRVCLPVPTFHTFGATIGSVMLSARGCTLVLTGYRYGIDSVTRSIVNHKCTHFMAVPTMLMDMMDYLDKNADLRITSLINVLTAATLVPYQVVNKLSRMVSTLKSIDIFYGATETGPIITFPKLHDKIYDKLDNVGLPLDGIEVKIVNHESGDVVKIGEKGELLARGHNIFLGYWCEDAQTKMCMNESRWFKTGDLATMDSKGYIRIVGRIKDIIIRGGMNIYPKEIEDVLISNPLISFAAVFGIPDERLGEEICAWIKFRDESKKLTEAQVIKFCKEKIAYFKVPKKYVFVTEFPTTASGKVQKYRMKEITISMFNEVKSN